MRKTALRAFALSALSLFVGITPSIASADTINFGIINTESSQNLRPLWEPFLDDMRKETGLDVRPFFSSDYAGIVTAMQYGKVQLAWYGNKAAVEAVDRANAEVFARTMDEAGIGGYYSHLIVHGDSSVNSVDDLLANAETLTFGNGDPNSTSGFLVPGYYVFAQNDVDPKSIFKRTLNSNHETNALAVANKQIDVGTCNSEALARLQLTHPEKRDALKVIWTSPLIPDDPLVWRRDLAPETKEALTTLLFNYGTPGRPNAEREREILKALQWAPFKPATNDHLIPTRQLQLFSEKNAILNSASPSSDKSAQRLREIENELTLLSERLVEAEKNN